MLVACVEAQPASRFAITVTRIVGLQRSEIMSVVYLDPLLRVQGTILPVERKLRADAGNRLCNGKLELIREICMQWIIGRNSAGNAVVGDVWVALNFTTGTVFLNHVRRNREFVAGGGGKPDI